MDRARFEKPVTVLVGMGFPASIESVMEAYALLHDWPAANRNHTHAVALNACKAGIAGEVDPETVRAAFVAFARRNDILMQDIGIASIDAEFVQMAREDAAACRLATIPGVGVSNATALVAAVGGAPSFGRGRDLAGPDTATSDHRRQAETARHIQTRQPIFCERT